LLRLRCGLVLRRSHTALRSNFDGMYVDVVANAQIIEENQALRCSPAIAGNTTAMMSARQSTRLAVAFIPFIAGAPSYDLLPVVYGHTTHQGKGYS
jgi:hypothetical protein